MAQTRQTVERAIDLLACFNAQRPLLGVSQLAAETEIEKSVVSRLMATLEKKGLVRKDRISGRYYLGGGILQLADAVRADALVVERGEPYLHELAGRTGETVVVAVRRGGCCLCVKVIESSHSLRAGPKLGEHIPLHAGAVGRAILAFLTPEEQGIYMRYALERLNRGTLVKQNVLEPALDIVREKGFAVSMEEINDGVAAVAAPIRDRSGAVQMSVCLDMPVVRFKRDEYARLVCETAGKLSKLLED